MLPAMYAFFDQWHKHLSSLSDTNKLATKEHVFHMVYASAQVQIAESLTDSQR